MSIPIAERAEEVVALLEAPGIPRRVEENLMVDLTNTERLVTAQNPLDRGLHVLVGDQDDQIVHRFARD